MQPKHRALLLRSHRLRTGLEKGWLFVRPGGSHADDERYLVRFLELLGEYEQAEDELREYEGAATSGDYGTELWTQYAAGVSGYDHNQTVRQGRLGDAS